MAIIYQATITPTKAELVAVWLSGQPWFAGSTADLRPVGAYRFDDPAGEVGIEAHLFAAGDRLVHVPLTYRGAPLDGAERWLVGTTEHSVLGARWVYDGLGDPVFRAELTRVILEADTEVEQVIQAPDGPQLREPSMRVRGSGTPGGSRAESDRPAEIVVVNDLDQARDQPSGPTLTGTWSGRDEPTVLAYLV